MFDVGRAETFKNAISNWQPKFTSQSKRGGKAERILFVGNKIDVPGRTVWPWVFSKIIYLGF